MSTKIQKKLNRIMHPIIMEIELKKKAKENSRNCKQNETCYQLSSSQHSNMNSSIDNIDKFMEKKFKREYSFISFNNDKILSEINELKNSFMLPSTTSPSVVSNGIYHKPHPQHYNNKILYNNNNNNMNINYNKTFIPKQRPYKTLFKLYDKPNKAKLIFSQKQHNHQQQNGINNYNQETSLVTPFNHNNDLDYVTFMKEMSEYKEQKIAEWKDVYLDY